MLSITNIVDSLKELKRIEHTVTEIFSPKCAAAMNFTNSLSTIKDVASCRVVERAVFLGVHPRYFACYRAEFRIMPYYHLDECVSYHRHKSKTPITVRLQHTTGLFSGNRSGSRLSFHNHYSSLKKSSFSQVHRWRITATFTRRAYSFVFSPSIESLLILALLSMERYIAMKFSLRYASLMTTLRLTGAVLCSWIISVISVILRLIPGTYSFAVVFVYVTVIPAISIIVFCHTTVYLVSRRHMRRIKTETASKRNED